MDPSGVSVPVGCRMPNTCTEPDKEQATYRNRPSGSATTPTGPPEVATGPPGSAVSEPSAWIVNPVTVLLLPLVA